MRIIILFISLCLPLFSQTHGVQLSWNDTTNPSGTTYNVYRAAGSCDATFSLIRTGSTDKTYFDPDVTTGTYCYYVKAVYDSQESASSNNALASFYKKIIGGKVTITGRTTQ